ncbi:hypothetical protein [Microvirga mediterraneensis]|uniref:Bbp19-like phage domain-containing protein n=1 Tax=Microvirga mediterraneensis TaxID=2754695 RepID=A0A838BVT3_9HYPH|nr:hypothetical protein [Microvirga mediterraneensis]MBA1159380.1 hypothetical protein [Microvirga mediterraneensis]
MTHLEQFEQELAEEIATRERDDLRKVLDSREGRRVLWSLLDAAGVYGLSYTGEAMSTGFNEGRRSVGITLLQKIEDLAPGSFLTMQREVLEEKQTVEGLRKAAAEKDEGESE